MISFSNIFASSAVQSLHLHTGPWLFLNSLIYLDWLMRLIFAIFYVYKRN